MASREATSVDVVPGAAPAEATFLPFHQPWIDEAEVAEVVDTLRSGWLTMGPKTLRFEAEFARYVGARHAVAVSSATAGLHLALDALGLQPGDEVITSVYTFTATAAVVLHHGAVPILADVLPGSLTLDPEDVAAKITARTRVIIPVHLAGAACDLDPLLALAARHGFAVVEDAAHALPTRYRGRLVGTIGDLTVFSFYATKNITTGEGGMVTTDSDEYADRLRTRRLHGISRDAWKRYAADGSWYYEVDYPGYKCNMTDLNAALGVHQLAKCDRFHDLRSAHARRYQAGLADLPELRLPQPPPWSTHAWHLYIVQLELERLTIDRGGFVELLRRANIGASVHFIPLHLHPYYRRTFGYGPQEFPRALDAYRRAVSLPLYPRLGEADVARVIAGVRSIIEAHRMRRAA